MFCFILLVLSGCASGPKYTEMLSRIPELSQDNGRIYLYRSTTFGAALQPTIKINNNIVGESIARGFVYVDRPAGTYLVETSTEDDGRISVNLEKGRTKYVRLGVGFGLLVGRVYPELVDEKLGASEIMDLSYTGRL
ncbi:MAG: DUF2846 domain-containing protein [Magnetococcales bacterium]|nr:DUF2846 domain-containing protein [Magnetococcales bacterium]